MKYFVRVRKLGSNLLLETFTFSSISITAIMLQQKKTQIKKWLSLKSIGLGESDLDYDGGNCISSKVMGQVHKYLNIKIYLKKGHNF